MTQALTMSNFRLFCGLLVCAGLLGGCVSEELQREMHLKRSKMYDLRAQYLYMDSDRLKMNAETSRKNADVHFRCADFCFAIEGARKRFAQLLSTNRPDIVQAPLDPRLAFKTGPAPEPRSFLLPGGIPFEMVGIGPGSFVMGTQKPIDDVLFLQEVGHKVTLRNAFWIGKFEVTQDQYNAIVGTNRYADVTRQVLRGGDLPAFDLTWREAKALAVRLNELLGASLPAGYRFDLPTEAQWEYACRAGSVESFNWGKAPVLTVYPPAVTNGMTREVRMFDLERFNDEWTNHMWFVAGETQLAVHPVGKKRPNAWGLYDMHGNAGEWCLDWFGDYPANNVIDPVGPKEGTDRVARGGSVWDGYLRNLTSHGRGIRKTMMWNWNSIFGPYGDHPDANLRDRDASCLAGVRLVLTKTMNPSLDAEDAGVYGVRMRYAGGDELNKRLSDSYMTMIDDIRNACRGYWTTRRELVENDRELAKKEQALLEKMEQVMTEIKLATIEAEIASERAENNIRTAALWQSIAGEAMEIILPAIQAGVEAAANEVVKQQGGVPVSMGGGDAGGFATIKGPSSLTYDSAHRNGQTARYSLYVGGRDVTEQTTWGTAGTSISVNGNGRAMAGNPPCGRGGSFKTGVRATYNGKSYTKNITILKR